MRTFKVVVRHKNGSTNTLLVDEQDFDEARQFTLKEIPTAEVALVEVRPLEEQQ